MTTMGTSRLAGALAPEFRDPLLAALLTEAPAATVVVDEGGHIVHANQAFLELHHLSSKDMGRHLRDASIDLWIQLEPVLDRVRDGFSVELNRVTLGHDCAPSRRYWEERWRPVHDDEGRVIATLGVAVDVTAFRNERDEQARLAEVRGRLIETASHELRGPLASVLGFAHRLGRIPSLPPEAAEAAQAIREQAQEMAFRLDLFLGVSELDAPVAAASPTGPEEFAVEDLLVREAEALRARHHQVAVDVHCGPGLTVNSNPHYVRQIVANLLDNAAKYGSGWIGLSADERRGRLVIRVDDDGDGISSEEQDRIFERGFRSPTAVEMSSSGKGLGLFVAREFAHRLGGRLTVRSEAGVGSTFELRIPLDLARAPRRRRPPTT